MSLFKKQIQTENSQYKKIEPKPAAFEDPDIKSAIDFADEELNIEPRQESEDDSLKEIKKLKKLIAAQSKEIEAMRSQDKEKVKRFEIKQTAVQAKILVDNQTGKEIDPLEAISTILNLLE